MPKPISEDLMLRRLVEEVKRRYPTLPLQNPDYRNRSFYAPQWRQHGALLYWKLGGDLEPILAAKDCARSLYYFNRNGLSIKFLRWVINAAFNIE